MKKLFPVFLLVLCFFGCKSSEVTTFVPEIDPLSLLEEDSSIYISIPASKNQELVSGILCARISGLAQKDAMSIAERTKNLYAGVGTVEDRSRLQIVSKTSIPHIVLQSALSKKNGWERSYFQYESKNFEKFIHAKSEFQAAFPASNLICSSQNVDLLLENFAENKPAPDAAWKKWISQEQPQGEIFFYITRPGQYLRSLIGQTVNVGTDAIYGTLKHSAEKNSPGQYELSFFTHLTDKRSAVALKALLSLSFAMTGGTIEQPDDLTLKISGIEISETKIADLFLRDPITGKHYKVVDDKVIEESVRK
ncbi:hypothetical protein [Treponema sp.]|uniref:hypothetical protein n=1 Tax=Treponema sp. TaxID=166 RepID=UPI003F096E5F